MYAYLSIFCLTRLGSKLLTAPHKTGFHIYLFMLVNPKNHKKVSCGCLKMWHYFLVQPVD